MQLRLSPKTDRGQTIRKIIIKAILFFTIFFVAIFFLDKIKISVPKELIKQEISNDKLTTLK